MNKKKLACVVLVAMVLLLNISARLVLSFRGGAR